MWPNPQETVSTKDWKPWIRTGILVLIENKNKAYLWDNFRNKKLSEYKKLMYGKKLK